jgi:hypothetical protein
MNAVRMGMERIHPFMDDIQASGFNWHHPFQRSAFKCKEDGVWCSRKDLERVGGLLCNGTSNSPGLQVTPGFVFVVLHLEPPEAHIAFPLPVPEELFGKEFIPLHADGKNEHAVGTAYQLHVPWNLGVIQPVFSGIKIFLGKMKQYPEKNGNAKT